MIQFFNHEYQQNKGSSSSQQMSYGVCDTNNTILTDAQIATHSIERPYRIPLFTPGCKTRKPSRFRLTFVHREMGFKSSVTAQYMDEDTGIFHHCFSCELRPKNKQGVDGEFYAIPNIAHPLHHIIGRCEMPIMRLIVDCEGTQVVALCFGIENGSRSRLKKSEKYMRKIYGATFETERPMSQQELYQQVLSFGSKSLQNYLDTTLQPKSPSSPSSSSSVALTPAVGVFSPESSSSNLSLEDMSASDDDCELDVQELQ